MLFPPDPRFPHSEAAKTNLHSHERKRESTWLRMKERDSKLPWWDERCVHAEVVRSSSLPLTSVSLSLTRSFVCLSLHIIGQLAVFKGKVGKNTLHSVQSVHIFPSVHRSGVRFFASVLKITVDCRFFFRPKYFYPRKTLCPLNLFKKNI